MDSLVLVLAVIGIIMVLAGIARMRSKRKRYGWDDIDHSVLFSKTGEDVESTEDLKPHEEPQFGRDLDRFADDADVAPAFELVEEQRPSDAPAQEIAKPEAPKRNRSLFGKLKRDKTGSVETVTTSIAQKYKQDAPDWVVIVNVMAPEGQEFIGTTLFDAIESLGLTFGEMEIYHHLKNNRPLYSVVNMVKPGSFDMQTADSVKTPGVSFFVQLPNQYDNGVDIFDNMVMTAQHLADILGGELRDERRSVLTSSATDYIRQQIAEYDCKWQVASQ